MTRPLSVTLGDRAFRDSVDPGTKAFFILKIGQRTLRTQENVLQHVVDVGTRHAPRDERAKALF
jgi:hypothetical protein